MVAVRLIFLSTPSARRATTEVVDGVEKTINFYPRPPRGGRHAGIDTERLGWIFLSTPSARRATLALGAADVSDKFLSTPSARRATNQTKHNYKSIQNFYPRPPRGGRRIGRKKP